VADLVFNLDEVGISDLEGRKTKKVVVPAAMLGQTIHHGVSRKVKHISVIVCVWAAGASLLPYIVTSQNSPVVQEHLKKQGACLDRDMILKFNQKPYINAGSFLDDIRTISLPYVDMLRGLVVFAQQPAVLLMDDCSVNVSDDVIRILTETNVRVITFASHTIQIFQVLDLTLFGVLKRRPRCELPFDDDNATVRFIMKGSHDFGQTMVRLNIWGAFRALGLEFDVGSVPYRLLFDKIKLRESAGFQELWSVDFALDQLSGRQRTARFGWINKPE
jgi:hypothetical protein